MLCCEKLVQVSCTVCQFCIVRVEYLTRWEFLSFLTDFVSRECFKSPPLAPPPPPMGHNIDRCIKENNKLRKNLGKLAENGGTTTTGECRSFKPREWRNDTSKQTCQLSQHIHASVRQLRFSLGRTHLKFNLHFKAMVKITSKQHLIQTITKNLTTKKSLQIPKLT